MFHFFKIVLLRQLLIVTTIFLIFFNLLLLRQLPIVTTALSFSILL